MQLNFDDHFLFTVKRMQEDIRAGKRAIEYALLQAYLRPHALGDEDEAEIAVLFDLHDKYEEVMARYETPKFDVEVSNDR